MPKNLKSIFGFLFAILALGLVSLASVPASAQQIQPLEIEPDPNGVDLITGQLASRVPALSVPGAGRLQINKVNDFLPYLSGKISSGQTSSYSINGGGLTSASLTCFENECTSTKRDGSTLVAGLGSRTFNFIEGGSGKQVFFDQQMTWFDNPGTLSVSFFASYVQYADGERHTFTYDTYTANLGGGFVIKYHRPAKVVSNRGYELRFTYQSNTGNTTTWRTLASAAIYKVGTPNTALAQYTYSGNTVTDIDGRTWNCGTCSFSMDALPLTGSTSLTLPSETTTAYNATATTAGSQSIKPVGQITNDGVVWNYTYQGLTSNPNNLSAPKFDKITATGPQGVTMTADVSHPGPSGTRAPYITKTTNSLGQATNYVHDTFGRLLKITYPEGNSVEVTYDAIGNITEKRAKSKPTSNLPDIVETAYYPGGVGVQPCFGANCFRPDWTRDAKGNQTDYTWHSTYEGLLTSKLEPVDANGQRRKTKYAYDAFRRLVSEEVCVANSAGVELTCGTAGNSFVTKRTYWGSTTLPATESVTDGANNSPLTTTYSYDSAGRTIAVDGPLPGSDDATYYRYDNLGRKTMEIGGKDENGRRPATQTFYRQADDQVVEVRSGVVAGNTTATSPVLPTLSVQSKAQTQYNSRRLATRSTVLTASNAPQSVTQMTYDGLNRQLCMAARMNMSSLPADACALGTQSADGPDRITRNHYDTLGRVVRIEQGVGTSLVRDYATYTFTPNGQLDTMTDARGYLAKMDYDGFDRQSHWYFPSKTATGQHNTGDYEKYTYDVNGNRTSLRKRDGSVISYQYDNLNQMTRKIVPARAGLASVHTRDVFYRYDIRGLQLHARFDSHSGLGVYNYYDRYGRVTSAFSAMEPGVTRQINYWLDEVGNRERISFPVGHPQDALFRYDFTTGGQFNTIRDPSNVAIINYNYSNFGQLSNAIRLSNAPDQSWTYDGIGRMASTTINGPGSTYDVTWSFTRNAASQIKSEAQTNDSFSWDGFQNLNRSYITNGLNQYTNVSGQAYCYDANGNLTMDSDYVYLYDVENRLVEMRAKTNSNCASLSYAGQRKAYLLYDPLGRLAEVTNYINGVSQGPQRFLHDGDALVAVFNASGSIIERHIHGPAQGVDDPLVSYYTSSSYFDHARFLHTDARGSIVYSSDRFNNNRVINTYDEYGQPSMSNQGRFQYTGQVWLPELGMYYYKARIYAPKLGRFMQTDPIGYEDNVNLYGYAGQDPINGVDPTGKAEETTRNLSNTCSRAGGTSCAGSYQALQLVTITSKPNGETAKANLEGGQQSTRPRGNYRNYRNYQPGRIAARFNPNLRTHEGGNHKGHTIGRHVGRTRTQLRNRAQREGRDRVSTFDNINVAQGALTLTINANMNRLNHGIRTGQTFFRLRATSAIPIGTVYNNNTGQYTRSSSVIFIVRHDASTVGPGTLRVITGYVE